MSKVKEVVEKRLAEIKTHSNTVRGAQREIIEKHQRILKQIESLEETAKKYSNTVEKFGNQLTELNYERTELEAFIKGEEAACDTEMVQYEIAKLMTSFCWDERAVAAEMMRRFDLRRK